MATPEELAARQQEVEDRVGHPGLLWASLRERVQDPATPIREFRLIQNDWVALMWALDAYRIAQVPPRIIDSVVAPTDLGAVNRAKGNWFAEIVTALLRNRTKQDIRARTKIKGFSQEHQIDVAWPPRDQDPLICIETKVTGAPAFGRTPARRATADFSNRRKELKFAATDLKLSRRDQETAIFHWGEWRVNAPPQTYFLWGARMHQGQRARDDIRSLIREAQALVDTYLEGAGVIAWRERESLDGYEIVPLPRGAQVTDLDDVLWRIESAIRRIAPEGSEPPPPQVPLRRAVDVTRLEPDVT